MSLTLSQTFKTITSIYEGNRDELAKKMAELCATYFLNSFLAKKWEGNDWDKLSNPYADIKAKKFPGKPILVKSGDLESAFLKSLVDGVSNATLNQIEFNVDNSYASFHNEGDGNLPKRQFMGINDELVENIVKLVEEEIQKELNRI